MNTRLRLLLAENEGQAGERLARGLCERGLHVDWARSGEEALRRVTMSAYDLVILDAALVQPGGEPVVAEIRRCQEAPLLFLAPAGLWRGHRHVEVGMDDYLARPFAMPELLARAGALIQRGTQYESDILRIADLEVHLLRRRVERAGRRVDLARREYALLLILIRRRGEVLSPAMLAEELCDSQGGEDARLVEAAVRRLRRKIDAAFESRLIHTARGAGYVMDAFRT